MGIVKQLWIEEMERGYGRPDGHICADCVEDEWLKQWVEDAVSARACSFCDSKSHEPMAASFEEFLGHVMTGIRFYWNHPDDEGIAYESAEGGYQASISDTSDIIWDLNVSDNQNVIDALISSIDDNGWVKRGFYAGTEGEWLSDGWARFKDLIKHHSRFFFLRPNELDYYYGPEIAPHEMLDTLSEVILKKIDVDKVIIRVPENTTLIRVRVSSEEYFTTAAALGSPPSKFATQSNRMSPAGVPMFYCAFNVETALAETFDPDIRPDALVSSGKFKPVRELIILDLTNIPKIPSIYDSDNGYLIHSLEFLHSFADDISKPIKRDGREHIEYVPTQIVTEYFRRVFRADDLRLTALHIAARRQLVRLPSSFSATMSNASMATRPATTPSCSGLRVWNIQMLAPICPRSLPKRSGLTLPTAPSPSGP